MPIYAYRCDSCGHAHDALQKISAAPLVDCPACGQPALKKQVTAAGFQLKGGGWYVTDFRNNNSGGAASAKPADATASAKPAETATPVTPAATPAASTDSGSKD